MQQGESDRLQSVLQVILKQENSQVDNGAIAALHFSLLVLQALQQTPLPLGLMLYQRDIFVFVLQSRKMTLLLHFSIFI